MKINFSLIFEFVFIMILSLFTTLYFIDYHFDFSDIKQKLTGNNINYDIEECSNLDFLGTNYCLNNFISEHFNYVVKDNDYPITDEELLNYGGDCLDYSKWYVKQFEQLGINAKLVYIDINSTNRHAIAISSSNDGYCMLDMNYIKCYEFGSEV